MSLSAEQVNEQALGVATEVLNDSVVAAARCEQVTQDHYLKVAGTGGAIGGIAKFASKWALALYPGVGNMSGGLPESFIVAVTATQVHALEGKEKRGKLVPGNVLKSWEREGFMASLGTDSAHAVSGAPEDRQILTLYLPLDDSKKKYPKSGNLMAVAGSPGTPTRFMIAKDEASEAVVKELVG